MKEYTGIEIEVIYLGEDLIRTSPIRLPEEEIGGDIGNF